MTEGELDTLYTQFCKIVTDLGEARSPLFLARFALLAMIEIDDVTALQKLIADAREGIESADSHTASAVT